MSSQYFCVVYLNLGHSRFSSSNLHLVTSIKIHTVQDTVSTKVLNSDANFPFNRIGRLHDPQGSESLFMTHEVLPWSSAVMFSQGSCCISSYFAIFSRPNPTRLGRRGQLKVRSSLLNSHLAAKKDKQKKHTHSTWVEYKDNYDRFQ